MAALLPSPLRRLRPAAPTDVDDPFAASRMPLGEHLEELRARLWRALVGVAAALALVLCLDGVGIVTQTRIGIARPVKDVLCRPVEQQLLRFYERRVDQVLAGLETDPELRRLNRPGAFARLGFSGAQLQALLAGQPAAVVNRFPCPASEAAEPAAPDGAVYQLWVREEEPLRQAAWRQAAEREVSRRPALTTLSATEGMLVYVRVVLLCSVFLASPWVFGQAWAFIAAGLYPSEQRPIYVYLPAALVLFWSGALLCQFLVIPPALETLFWFNEWLGFEPDLRLSEWLSFALWMPLVFGISFQMPLALRLLGAVGLVTADFLRERRRMAWFALVAFAAVVTPSTDYICLLSLWLPLCALYELGILLCPRARPLEYVEA